MTAGFITAFEFKSDRFKPTPAEADEEDPEINPGLFARELAFYLMLRLRRRGVRFKFRAVEDWGHYLEVARDGRFRLAVCCGCEYHDDDGSPIQLVFLEPNKPVLRN